MKYMWELAERMGIQVTHVDARNIDMDTFEADLPGELIDLMPCDWCGKPVYDLIQVHCNLVDHTHVDYMICEDCHIIRDRIDETGAPF